MKDFDPAWIGPENVICALLLVAGEDPFFDREKEVKVAFNVSSTWQLKAPVSKQIQRKGKELVEAGERALFQLAARKESELRLQALARIAQPNRRMVRGHDGVVRTMEEHKAWLWQRGKG